MRNFSSVLSSALILALALCVLAGCGGAGGYASGLRDGAYYKNSAAENDGQIEAGQMTAAELRDLADLDKWTAKFSSGQDGESRWKENALKWGFSPQYVRKITVTDGEGRPAVNYPVEILKDSDVIFRAVTDIEGNAYVFAADADGVTVRVGNETRESSTISESFTVGGVAPAPSKLDLMLMVDTTGSMGDELSYLKAELKDVVRRVAEAGELDIAVSVNFYRDSGDQYVVREFGFETDPDVAADNINKQHADGGGDFPEAVDKALEAVAGKSGWREDSIKICLLVLDAPPHTEDEQKGINQSLQTSVKEAARKGIRIIPVTASGIDDATEHIMRTFAVMTGGTYVFITGHSGIGGSHKAPDTEEDYTVEYLNECLIRIICRYCGVSYTPEKVFVPATEEQSGPDSSPAEDEGGSETADVTAEAV